MDSSTYKGGICYAISLCSTYCYSVRYSEVGATLLCQVDIPCKDDGFAGLPIVYLDGVVDLVKYQGAIVVLRCKDDLVEVITLNGDDILTGDIARTISLNILEYDILTNSQSLILSMFIHTFDSQNNRIRSVVVLADVI
ncbi:hypothetical protein [Xylanibacter ruminicola]|uniref:hypothetical protein n=1 Tax=Xylanibacter ruminicola TaxID=839 RepID=UPI0011B03247|nr:hypothetical protein [Xylanibacter ruminicola]